MGDVLLRITSLPSFLSLSLSLILQPTQTFLCGLTPECVQVSCLTLSKESGGWKEAHSSTPAFEQAHMKPHTHTHTHWQEQTHSLHAEKKTKCQGWFWETTAGAAVGMETAVV